MSQQTPEHGMNVVLSWSLIEWGLTTVMGVVLTLVGYILRLGRRIDRLEADVKTLPDREFIAGQFSNLQSRIDHLYRRSDET